MSDMTHADKIAYIQQQLRQIARDSEKLQAQDVDALISEVTSLATMTENRIFNSIAHDIYSPCNVQKLTA
jgi:hypothetical protein